MPCAADPTPYMDANSIEQHDHFSHSQLLSPLLQQWSSQSPKPQQTAPPRLSIPRKPVGSTDSQIENGSCETIIRERFSKSASTHKSCDSAVEQHLKDSRSLEPKAILTAGNSPRYLSPDEQAHPFLGRTALPREPGGQLERKVTVISYQSVSTKPVLTHQPLAQSRKALVLRKYIPSLTDHQPVPLKDTITARISANALIPKEPYLIWMPPTPIKTEPDKPAPSISTSIITTTGYIPIQKPLYQVDGSQENVGETQVRVPSLQHKMARPSLKPSSPPNNKQNVQQSAG